MPDYLCHYQFHSKPEIVLRMNNDFQSVRKRAEEIWLSGGIDKKLEEELTCY